LVGYALLASFDRGHAQVVAQAPVASAPMMGATSAALLVNPTSGDDAVADGSDRAPFKTITRALQVAPAGTVILLTSGTYSQETGETFPLRLKPDVTIQGNTETRGQDIVIQGSGFFLSPTFARQKVTIVGADRAILAGVTVKNPDPQGYGVWIESTSPAVIDSTFTESGHDGISVTGNGSPLIRNNFFYQNGANGITIYGTSRAEVRENIFEQTGFAINVNQKAAPLLVGNRITQNKDGIVVQAKAQPILRNNSVEGNTRDGLVAIAQSRPDLGTATEPGGNSFRSNGQLDVNAKQSDQQIPAFGNDLDKTSGTLDLAGTSAVASTPAGSPMPWSSSSASGSPTLGLAAASRSSGSADNATAGNKATARNQKPILAPRQSIAATDTNTISFGQRLGSDRPARAEQPAPSSLQSSAPTLEKGSAGGISAASFPVPQTSVVAKRPALPLIVPANTVSQPTVPKPSVASGATTQASTPRPIPVVRLATAPQITPQVPLQEPVEPNSRALPTVVVRPSRQQLSSPSIASIASPTSVITSRAKLAPPPVVQPSAIPRTGSIEIPVPAPERRSTPSPERSVAPERVIASASTPLTSPGLLPVPSPNAPIGNVGNASIVYRTQQTASSGGFASRTASGLRYRVVVVPADDSQQAQLRTTFPNAFRTFVKGRTLMQVGAFSDRTKADQLMQTLSSQGVQAMVETLE
jgi:parallel beta-helix repeat protein